MSLDVRTVLVVDDEPSILEYVDNIFTPLGYRTLLASTGEEALELTVELEEGVDLLVTDVVLPSMKGQELVKRFEKKYPETKILYMSGYMSPAISEEEHLNREKAFIQKPFLPKELVKISERLMEKRENSQ